MSYSLAMDPSPDVQKRQKDALDSCDKMGLVAMRQALSDAFGAECTEPIDAATGKLNCQDLNPMIENMSNKLNDSRLLPTNRPRLQLIISQLMLASRLYYLGFCESAYRMESRAVRLI